MGLIYSYLYETPPKRIYNWKKSSKVLEESKYLQITKFTDSKDTDLTSIKKFPKVYDQGELGSCTANAICCAFAYDYMNGNTDDSKNYTYNPSRLYLYYKEREVENDISVDNGAIIADGIACLEKQGVCSEDKWPYIIKQFNIKPPISCDDEASQHKTVSYMAVKQTEKDIITCLSSGFPVVFGFIVYPEIESLDASSKFILPLPKNDEKSIGGHAVLIVGFNSETKLFKIRNSWGENWGDNGYFYMPYEYVLNSDLSSDFWVLSKVKSIKQLLEQVV